ncbi:MAG: pitrilysin family protein [Planctomycetota bacterium]|nr:pitrilysin family protein [Planctomycetota bacterium]
MSRRLGLLVLALGLGPWLVGSGAAQRTTATKLKNGLKVILRPLEGADQVALVLLYSIGSDQDPEGRSGLAHLIEHLYVTSAAGDTPARTAEEFFSAYGNQANAQTGNAYTVIAAVFARDKLEVELKDAAARMTELEIETSVLAREKGRLIAEVNNMFGKIPALGARNLAGERTRPTPLGGRKGGIPDHVNEISLGEIGKRLEKFYKPANAILVLAGGIDPEASAKLIRETFGSIPSGEPAPKPSPIGEPRLGKVDRVEINPVQPGTSSYVCAAYKAPSSEDELFGPFLILCKRFMRNVRKPGLRPFPFSYAPLDDPYKVYLIEEVREEESPEDALGRIDELVSRTLEPEFAVMELLELKSSFSILLWPETIPDAFLARNPYGLAFALGRHVQMGFSSRGLEQSLSRIQPEDIRKAGREIFGKSRRAVVVVESAE